MAIRRLAMTDEQRKSVSLAGSEPSADEMPR